MAFSFSPKAVTDGLVLALDAANSRSYVSGSTVWNNLTPTLISGSLINGPTFSSANGGTLVFDGSNDYIDCGNSANLQITVGTISAWVRTTSPGSSYRSIIAKQYAWGLFTLSSVLIAYDWGNSQPRSTGINIADGNWKNVAMTFTQTVGTPSNNAIIYLNGNSVLTTTVKHLDQTVGLQIGLGGITSSQYISGSIAHGQVYNRVLAPSEILQNYNALKGRFNLT